MSMLPFVEGFLFVIIMNNGWIKLHRKILGNPIWTSGDCYLFHLWCYILLSVNHKEKKILFNKKEIIIKKGEGIFGLNQIVKDCTKLKNENKPKFKKFKTIYYRKLKILESLGNVKLQPTNKFTIIKVLNWNRYQANETQVKLKWNSSETQVKTNKKEKNDKKEKKIDKSIRIDLSLIKNEPKKDIKIIYQYAYEKKIKTFNTLTKQSFIVRNIRAAQLLKGYSIIRIRKVMRYLEKNADFKWTLETVNKFIDENLEKLTKGQVKTLSIK